MRRVLLVLAVLPLVPLPLFVSFVSGCDEQPRGEQGIDYLIDGSYSATPPAQDAGTDAHPVCQEENGDPSGICAEASTSSPPASHLIVCTGGHAPAQISCVAGDGADASADAGTFCCTTGLL
jgi:hypothetical protein